MSFDDFRSYLIVSFFLTSHKRNAGQSNDIQIILLSKSWIVVTLPRLLQSLLISRKSVFGIEAIINHSFGVYLLGRLGLKRYLNLNRGIQWILFHTYICYFICDRAYANNIKCETTNCRITVWVKRHRPRTVSLLNEWMNEWKTHTKANVIETVPWTLWHNKYLSHSMITTGDTQMRLLFVSFY